MPQARFRCARRLRRTLARTRRPRAGPSGNPCFLERPVHEIASVFGERAKGRANVGGVDDSQPDERMLDASAIVPDGPSEDHIAQGLEHVAKLECAGEIMVAHGLVHLNLLACGERAEAEQRALSPEEMRLEKEV